MHRLLRVWRHPVKIVGVESIFVADGHFVRLHTDAGLSGLGQSACWAYPRAAHAVVEAFRPYLIGADPRDIERHWHHLYRMGPFRGSLLMAAVSAVDIALWDIAGKALKVPVWQLLGGRVRDRVRLCDFVRGDTDEELVTSVERSVRDGFTAVKLTPVPPDHRHLTHAQLTRVVDHTVSVVREAAPDVDIVVEFGRMLAAPQAASLVAVVARHAPLFVEDPIQIDSIREQARFAGRTQVAMAHGERMHSIWEFRELLEYSGPQVVRPDVGLAGGLSHCRKIAAVAESWHATISPHNCLGPVQTAASIHLDLAVPNFLVQEYNRAQDEGPAADGFATALRREGGWMPAPTAPGLGVEIDETASGQPPYLSRELHDIPTGPDGFTG